LEGVPAFKKDQPGTGFIAYLVLNYNPKKFLHEKRIIHFVLSMLDPLLLPAKRLAGVETL
jgi:hypothetical protein